MNPDVLTTAQFIETLVRIIDEIFFPALALWVGYLVRKWINGQLNPPAYRHEVELRGDIQRGA